MKMKRRTDIIRKKERDMKMKMKRRTKFVRKRETERKSLRIK